MRDALAQHPHESALVLLRVLLVVQERLLDGGAHEPGAEDVEDPAEVLDELRAEQDEDAAEDQRQDDAHHEHLLLHLLRHREPRHDHDEDEQVVDRQAVLGEPARDELAGVLGIAEQQHEQREDEREHDVEHDPQGRLPERRNVRTLHDEEEVADEDEGQDHEGSDFEPGGELEHWEAFRVSCGYRWTRKSLPTAPSARRHARSGVSGARTDDRGPRRAPRGILPFAPASLADGRRHAVDASTVDGPATAPTRADATGRTTPEMPNALAGARAFDAL